MKEKDIKKQIKSLEIGIDTAKDLVEKLKKELEQPEFEVGQWYIDTKWKYLVCLTDITEHGRLCGYGFFDDGEWDEEGSLGCEDDKTIRKATTEEVEEALIKEAKKRGFKEGVRFKNMDNGAIQTIHDFPFRIHLEEGSIIQVSTPESEWKYQSNPYIFDNGKWAEIIPEKIEINGYEMKVDGDIVSFGCAKFHKQFFKEAYWSIQFLNGKADEHGNKHRGIEVDNKSIKLNTDVEFTEDQLEQIIEKL